MGAGRVQVRPVIFCLLIVVLAFGCGEDTPSPPQPTNALASARIRAVDGGTVTVPSPHPLAGTSIAIPPGALDADTTISIFAAPVPALPGVMGLAIDLQPDGTAFRVPVTVTLVYNEADLPAGTREERLSMAKVSANGTLVPLTNVRVDTAANMVRGDTTSLSVYVLVLPSNTAPHTAPVANAGPDQTVVVDANGHPGRQPLHRCGWGSLAVSVDHGWTAQRAVRPPCPIPPWCIPPLWWIAEGSTWCNSSSTTAR